MLFKRLLKESSERPVSLGVDMDDILRILNIERPETFYANNAGAGHNFIEIRIRFSFIHSLDSIRSIVEIAVPPMIAKGLVKILDDEVKSYETNVGPIYMPDDKSGLEALFGTQIRERTDE